MVAIRAAARAATLVSELSANRLRLDWSLTNREGNEGAGFFCPPGLLLTRSGADLGRIARIFEFGRAKDLENWVRLVLPLACRLRKTARAEAVDGRTRSTPGPHANPANAPVDYPFDLWTDLSESGHGKHRLDFIYRAIDQFAR